MVPSDHLLRRIDAALDLSWLRGEMKAHYSPLGCPACHVPRTDAGALAQEFYPYSVFLLHDMGKGLTDEGTGSEARERRTVPLWDLGQRRVASDVYLHDGQVRSTMGAILWHGGEAWAARKNVRVLAMEVRSAPIAFLGAL